MRVRVVLVAALLVLTAGCNTLGGEPTPTLTPAEVPTPSEPSPTERANDGPVISAAGIADADRLASRHVAVLQNTSYRWSEVRREFGAGRDERGVTAFTGITTVRNGSRFVNRFEFDGPATSRAGQYFLRLDAYGNDTASYVRRETSRSDGFQYERSENPRTVLTPHRTSARSIRTYLGANSTSVSPLSDADEEVYLVTGSFDDHVSYGPVENGSVRAVVHADGYVRRLTATFTATVGERRAPIEHAFRYRSIGNATVTEPPWVETARGTGTSGPSWVPSEDPPADGTDA